MMSAKMTTPGLFKITGFLNKGYDVIIYVNDVTNKILSRDSNYIVDMLMWPKVGNCSISMKEVIKPQFYKDLTRKTAFLRGDLGFNNLGLALGTNLKFYNSVAKGLKLKGRKVWRLIPTFVEVTGEKLVLCFNLQFYYFSSVILCSGVASDFIRKSLWLVCQESKLQGYHSKMQINGPERQISGALTEQFKASQSTNGSILSTTKHYEFFYLLIYSHVI